MNEKRDDEDVDLAATAIRRHGGNGWTGNYFRGFFAASFFGSPHNFNRGRGLLRHRLALAKGDRDICNRRAWLFSAA
jgi:hypothetical protein